MFRTRLLCAAITAIFAVALPAPQDASAGVTVSAALGHDVIHESDDGRIFLRLSLKGIAAPSNQQRTPVNIALVLDRSGSMRGKRLEGAKAAAKMVLGLLSPDDIVSLIAYNQIVKLVQPAGRLGAPTALQQGIDDLSATGTTALHAGVVEGARQIREFIASDKVSRVILLSDGLANVGPSKPAELAELGRKLGAEGISVTTIGLGLQYNEDLMSKLALASDGNHAFVEKPGDLVKIFNAEFGDVLSVVAKDIIIEVQCRSGFVPKRILGRAGKIEGNSIKIRLNQLYGAQERYIIVELEAAKTRPASGNADVAAINVDFLDLQTKTRQTDRALVRARFTASQDEAGASVNKGVMTQVTTQIATETNEKAVALRDKGDIAGARRLLQDNARFLKERAKTYAAPELGIMGMMNGSQAGNLDAGQWARTRKGMRAGQHRSKNQQSY